LAVWPARRTQRRAGRRLAEEKAIFQQAICWSRAASVYGQSFGRNVESQRDAVAARGCTDGCVASDRNKWTSIPTSSTTRSSTAVSAITAKIILETTDRPDAGGLSVLWEVPPTSAPKPRFPKTDDPDRVDEAFVEIRKKFSAQIYRPTSVIVDVHGTAHSRPDSMRPDVTQIPKYGRGCCVDSLQPCSGGPYFRRGRPLFDQNGKFPTHEKTQKNTTPLSRQ